MKPLLVQLLLAAALSLAAASAELKHDLYSAVVNDNGAFRVAVVDGPTLNVSFVRRWTAFQRPPHTQFVRRGGEDTNQAFTFKYFWDKGEVVERIEFNPTGFSVFYDYTPSLEGDQSYLTLLVENNIPAGAGYQAAALRYEGQGSIDTCPFPMDERIRYSQISAWRKNEAVVCLAAENGAWINCWPGCFGVVNNGRSWDKTRYKAGQTYRTGVTCQITGRASSGR